MMQDRRMVMSGRPWRRDVCEGAFADTTASPPPEAPWLVWVGVPRLASPMLHLGLSHSDAPSGRLAFDAEPANGDEFGFSVSGLHLRCYARGYHTATHPPSAWYLMKASCRVEMLRTSENSTILSPPGACHLKQDSCRVAMLRTPENSTKSHN